MLMDQEVRISDINLFKTFQCKFTMILYLFLLLPSATLGEVKVCRIHFFVQDNPSLTINQQHSIENTLSSISQIFEELNIMNDDICDRFGKLKALGTLQPTGPWASRLVVARLDICIFDNHPSGARVYICEQGIRMASPAFAILPVSAELGPLHLAPGYQMNILTIQSSSAWIHYFHKSQWL